VYVLRADQLEVVTLDSVNKLFIAGTMRRKLSLVFMKFLDSLDQHMHIVSAAIALQGFA
jgi:hypothetical protein